MKAAGLLMMSSQAERGRKLAWALLVQTCLWPMGPAIAQPLQENPPRVVGYALGDVLAQRVAISAEDTSLDLSGLARASRVGRWLERQSATIVDDDDGQHWLELRYQVVNVPTTVTRAELPAIEEVQAAVEMQPWTFTLSPLLPPSESASEAASQALPVLLPDRAPVPLDTRAIERRLILGAGALTSVLLAWLGWWLWRNRHDRLHLPFNRAYRALQQEARPAAEASPEAWRLVHQALNQAAGRTVQPASVPMLVARQPWLAPEQQRIDAFYQASAALFFEQPGRAEPFSLYDFCRDLARAERRADPTSRLET